MQVSAVAQAMAPASLRASLATAREAPVRQILPLSPSPRLLANQAVEGRGLNLRAVALTSGSAAAAAGLVALVRGRGRRRATRQYRRERSLVAMAASAEAMADVISRRAPKLAEVARVDESRSGNPHGDGLGLFARKSFKEGETIHVWRLDDGTVMRPSEVLSGKLEAGDFGALAFQVLKAERSPQASPWKEWLEAGASAPSTHPLKLLISDPELAKRLWSSTTCGGRMSGMAFQVRDDLEMLKGGATLEEWTDTLSLVMSHSLAEDTKGRPLLALGLDLIQDGDFPLVKVQPAMEQVGKGPLGFGSGGEEVFVGIELVAMEDIEAGQELSLNYLPEAQ
ncbi:unnamed protein product, partial [Polarella glacialis]